MDESVIYDLGVDIDSSFNFHDGDLVLSRYQDNLVQGVVNRLNTDLDELDLFYEGYGSVFSSFLGWRGNDETISYMKSELEQVLQAEPRLESWEYDIKYKGNGKMIVELQLYPARDESVSVSLELTENGLEVIE